MKTFIGKIKAFFNFSSPENNKDFLLEKGEKVEIKVPEELLNGQVWQITSWHCEVGDIIKPGDLICTIESKDISSDFEAFFQGKVNYRNTSKSSLTKDAVIVEIIGD
ncbi:lipoyl domain-containing protein [Aureibaculum conchae]|uniref:lipoyl domain-containing protein n=1 Tax=Aureibaculum sp. 2308TA14-22 TaxID=3108392 RepID=UPI0033967AC9